MTLSTQFQTTLDASTKNSMDAGYFSSPEQDPITPDMMTPLESVFAQEAKRRGRQEADDFRPAKRARGPCRRIPCKARGMSSASHNMDTAFFDVPLDAPHGMLLCCSHPECADSGRRFRFCSVCEMPFAKRNFLKRHGHGVVHSSKELNEDDVDNLLCQVIQSSSPSPAPQTRPRHRRVVSFDGNSRSLIEENNSETIINENEQRWLELLKQRPETQDQKQMTAWMDKVISFSDESSHRSPSESCSIRAPAPVLPMTTSVPSPIWDAIGDAFTAPLETEHTELAAFMDDFDFSAVCEDDNDAIKGEVVEKVDRNVFWPVSV